MGADYCGFVLVRLTGRRWLRLPPATDTHFKMFAALLKTLPLTSGYASGHVVALRQSK